MFLLLLACSPETPVTAPRADQLDGPATVIRDTEGVSHVYATSDDDVFFLQGYVTASDRLFQMDLLRRRAHGRRAEVLGEDYLSSDVQSRALRFTEVGEEQIRWMEQNTPEMHRNFVAYAAGVSHFIAEGDLSPQFAALDYTPEPWTAEDSAAIEKLLTAGLSLRTDQDIILGMLRLLVSDDLFADLYRYAPLDRAYTTPDFYADRTSTRRTRASGESRVQIAAQPSDLVEVAQAAQRWDLGRGGSNSMAVAGQQSETGHALLASDSHQGIEHPAVYYLIHLNTADAGGVLDVIGATFPGVPFVVFGHNQRISWGPTTNLYDVADAYLETMADDDEVRFEGQDVPIEITEHTIAVRGQDDRIVETRYVPHHGPMFPADDLPLPLNISVRWTGYRPQSVAPAFYGMNAAKDFADFQQALLAYHSGGMHWAYADVDGNIGYSSYTEIPVRETLDPDNPPIALLPGEGGYEWLPGDTDAGIQILSPDDVPWTVNPPAGWIATANNDPFGQTDDNDPYNDPVYLSGVFDIGTRVFQPARQFEALIEDDGVSFGEMRQVQLDTLSRPAERLMPFVLNAAARRPDLLDERSAAAIDVLEAWDYHCAPDAVAPTIFHAWLAIFTREVLADEAGGLLGDLLFAEMDYQFGLVTMKMVTHFLEITDEDIDAIESGEKPFPSRSGLNLFDDQRTEAFESRDALILGSLDTALDELARMYADKVDDPDDINTYTWGRVHTIYLKDFAMESASSERMPMPGGAVTVNVGDFTWMVDSQLPERFEITNGPSNRFLYEMAPGAIRGEMILPGGQNERPGNAHHNDMLLDYTQGAYRPMRFYPDEVAAGAEDRRAFPARFPR